MFIKVHDYGITFLLKESFNYDHFLHFHTIYVDGGVFLIVEHIELVGEHYYFVFLNQLMDKKTYSNVSRKFIKIVLLGWDKEKKPFFGKKYLDFVKDEKLKEIKKKEHKLYVEQSKKQWKNLTFNFYMLCYYLIFMVSWLNCVKTPTTSVEKLKMKFMRILQYVFKVSVFFDESQSIFAHTMMNVFIAFFINNKYFYVETMDEIVDGTISSFNLLFSSISFFRENQHIYNISNSSKFIFHNRLPSNDPVEFFIDNKTMKLFFRFRFTKVEAIKENEFLLPMEMKYSDLEKIKFFLEKIANASYKINKEILYLYFLFEKYVTIELRNNTTPKQDSIIYADCEDWFFISDDSFQLLKKKIVDTDEFLNTINELTVSLNENKIPIKKDLQEWFQKYFHVEIIAILQQQIEKNNYWDISWNYFIHTIMRILKPQINLDENSKEWKQLYKKFELFFIKNEDNFLMLQQICSRYSVYREFKTVVSTMNFLKIDSHRSPATIDLRSRFYGYNLIHEQLQRLIRVCLSWHPINIKFLLKKLNDFIKSANKGIYKDLYKELFLVNNLNESCKNDILLCYDELLTWTKLPKFSRKDLETFLFCKNCLDRWSEIDLHINTFLWLLYKMSLLLNKNFENISDLISKTIKEYFSILIENKEILISLVSLLARCQKKGVWDQEKFYEETNSTLVNKFKDIKWNLIIKKFKNDFCEFTLYLIQFVFHITNSNYDNEIIIFKDATSSVYQHLFIFLRETDEKMLSSVNLLSNYPKHDFYRKILNEIKKELSDKDIDNSQIIENFRKKNKSKIKELPEETSKSLKKEDKEDKKEKNKYYHKFYRLRIHKFQSDKTEKPKKTKKIKKEPQYILIEKNKVNDILSYFGKEIGKVFSMTRAYNSRQKSREMDFFRAVKSLNIWHKLTYKEWHVIFYAFDSFVENTCLKKCLDESDALRKLILNKANLRHLMYTTKDGFPFNSSYVICKVKRPNILWPKKSKFNFHLPIYKTIDVQKINNSILANIIHNCDANTLRRFVDSYNYHLSVNCFLIHDSFGCFAGFGDLVNHFYLKGLVETHEEITLEFICKNFEIVDYQNEVFYKEWVERDEVFWNKYRKEILSSFYATL